MDAERIREMINKIPVMPIVGAILLYYGYIYYTFTTDPSSPLGQKKAEIELARNETQVLERKLREAQDFLKNLESKKQELRTLAAELDGIKATLSTSLDVGEFMRMVVTEAKKVGLSVISLKPAEQRKSEYYVEQVFDMTIRGVYVQVLVFLDRMSQVQKIVRIDEFGLRPISQLNAKFVQLEGAFKIKAYYYQGSKADELARDPAPASGSEAAKEGGK
jgi:Tfp pilus assembly protein PilO